VVAELHHAVRAARKHPLSLSNETLRGRLVVVLVPHREPEGRRQKPPRVLIPANAADNNGKPHVNKENHFLYMLLGSLDALAAGRRCVIDEKKRLGMKPLPPGPVAFTFVGGAGGCGQNMLLECTHTPTLIIGSDPLRLSQAPVGTTGGILTPNPFFGHPAKWSQVFHQVRTAGLRRGINERNSSWRILYRGGLDYSPSTWCAPAARNISCSGSWPRLGAAALTCAEPRLFDIRLDNEDFARFDIPMLLGLNCTYTAKARWGLQATLAELAAREQQQKGRCCLCKNGRSAYTKSLKKQEYTYYPVVLNLPGSTTAHYSRNLNHLWATGGAVINWNRTPPPRNTTAATAASPSTSAADATALFREWYYAGLVNRETHIEVGSIDELQSVADDLLRRGSRVAAERRERLSAAAGLVAEHLVCPCCLIAHHSQMLDAMWAQQSSYAGSHTERALSWRMEQFSRRTGGGGWRECRLESLIRKREHGELDCVQIDDCNVTCREVIVGASETLWALDNVSLGDITSLAHQSAFGTTSDAPMTK